MRPQRHLTDVQPIDPRSWDRVEAPLDPIEASRRISQDLTRIERLVSELERRRILLSRAQLDLSECEAERARLWREFVIYGGIKLPDPETGEIELRPIKAAAVASEVVRSVAGVREAEAIVDGLKDAYFEIKERIDAMRDGLSALQTQVNAESRLIAGAAR